MVEVPFAVPRPLVERPLRMYGQCKDCVFWRSQHGNSQHRPLSSDYETGDCHSHSPALVMTTYIGQHETRWPATKGNQGCGDFQPVPNA